MGPVTISPGSSGALNFGYGIECSIFLELIRRVYRRLVGHLRLERMTARSISGMRRF